MTSRRALGSYYTPAATVERALDGLPAPPPGGRVVDLSCGDGAWLVAARLRWPDARLIGVDVDPRALAAARRRLGEEVELLLGDGLALPIASADLIVGNPPWGLGRGDKVRRGVESASRFVARALELLAAGGRLCLLLPAAWLEIAAHRGARELLTAAAALERLEPLGDIFPGVFAPAALVVARREPDPRARAAAPVWTPRGRVAQSALTGSDGPPTPRLGAPERALLAKLDERGERLLGRVRFILGVVTGGNRAALGNLADEGEPILTGPDVRPLELRAPARRLRIPLERTQQAAPRSAYARPKIVYRFIARHPIAAVDHEGRLTLNSANAFAVEDPALDPDFVAGVLNSTPLRFAHAARRALPRILRSHLERLPLPRGAAVDTRAIAELARARRVDALDELVMDLFALSDGEREHLRVAWPPS